MEKFDDNLCSFIPLDAYHNVTERRKVDSNKLRFNVKNEMTLICAKFDADLVNISNVTSRKPKRSRFFGLPGKCSNAGGLYGMLSAQIYVIVGLVVIDRLLK